MIYFENTIGLEPHINQGVKDRDLPLKGKREKSGIINNFSTQVVDNFGKESSIDLAFL